MSDYKVTTVNGTTLHDCVPGTRSQENKDGDPLSEDAAGTLATEANTKAEQIGIETRYEVREVTNA